MGFSTVFWTRLPVTKSSLDWVFVFAHTIDLQVSLAAQLKPCIPFHSHRSSMDNKGFVWPQNMSEWLIRNSFSQISEKLNECRRINTIYGKTFWNNQWIPGDRQRSVPIIMRWRWWTLPGFDRRDQDIPFWFSIYYLPFVNPATRTFWLQDLSVKIIWKTSK